MKRSITRYMTAGLALAMILPAGAGVSMKADAAEETWWCTGICVEAIWKAIMGQPPRT